MATKLFLRDAKSTGIGIFRDLSTTAGAGVAPLGAISTAASGTEIQWKNEGQVELLEWISGRAPAGGFTLAGAMNFSIWARESNMAANCGARARVFKRTAAGSESEVAGGPYNDGVEFGTAAAEYTWTGTPTSTAFAEDDRLIVRFYITNIGTMGGGYTCSIDYGAPDASQGDSFFEIFENVTFKAEAVAYSMPADPGSYTYTGTAADLKRGFSMVADAGSYTITGTAAGLAKGFAILAAAGVYALTGTDAALSRTHIMPADAGSYTITGTAATLLKGFEVVATPGSYALTGTAATLSRTFVMPADPGSYTLTGTAATLSRAITITADPGSYVYTGTAATLFKTGASPVLTADPGSYAITGTAASLLRNRALIADAGSYTITGTATGLLRQLRVAADAGSYTITGLATGLIKTWMTPAAPGSYTITGTAADLLTPTHYSMVASPGSYTITGTAVTFDIGGNPILNVDPGVYSITGTPVTFGSGIVADLVPDHKQLVVFRHNEQEVVRVPKLNALSNQAVSDSENVYSLAELASLSPLMGLTAHVWNATGGYTPVYGDGFEWRRVSDQSVVFGPEASDVPDPIVPLDGTQNITGNLAVTGTIDATGIIRSDASVRGGSNTAAGVVDCFGGVARLFGYNQSITALLATTQVRALTTVETYVGSGVVGSFTSTGLAVTGTFSATGSGSFHSGKVTFPTGDAQARIRLDGGAAAQYPSIEFVANSVATGHIVGNSGGVLEHLTDSHVFYNLARSVTFATLTSTGLAVTGAVEATSTIKTTSGLLEMRPAAAGSALLRLNVPPSDGNAYITSRNLADTGYSALYINAAYTYMQASNVTVANFNPTGMNVGMGVVTNPELHIQGDATNTYYPTLKFSGVAAIGTPTITGYQGFLYDVGAAKTHQHRVNSVTITEVSSTGLAVTGNISSTGTATATQFGTSGATAAFVLRDRDGVGEWQLYNQSDIVRFYDGTADKVTISSTGLAVTGDISGTGSIGFTKNSRSLTFFESGTNIYMQAGVPGSGAANGLYYITGVNGHDLVTYTVNSGQHGFNVGGVLVGYITATGLAVTGNVSASTRFDLPSYTVAGLPAVGAAGGMIFVSNETGGAVPAFSDGANWRRVTDRAIVA